MKKLTRTARGAVVALTLALLAAAPAAAAQPTRTVLHIVHLVGHYPAGTGCTFDVTSLALPSARAIVLDFSDGREVINNHSMHRVITNDATGATFEQSLVSHEVDRWDLEAGVIRGSVNGQSIFQFLPGDVFPDGSILDQPTALFIRGTVTYVIDATTFATLEISIEGTATDVCAAIS